VCRRRPRGRNAVDDRHHDQRHDRHRDDLHRHRDWCVLFHRDWYVYCRNRHCCDDDGRHDLGRNEHRRYDDDDRSCNALDRDRPG